VEIVKIKICYCEQGVKDEVQLFVKEISVEEISLFLPVKGDTIYLNQEKYKVINIVREITQSEVTIKVYLGNNSF
jgi:hypothetical protein